MKKGDFYFDHESFSDLLKRHAAVSEAAMTNLRRTLDSWPGLADKLSGGEAEILFGELGDRVSGKVLGKKFFIDFGVISSEGLALVEAVLSAPSLKDGLPREICRFFVNQKGDIISAENEILWTRDDDFQDDTLLIAVLNRVMQAPLAF